MEPKKARSNVLSLLASSGDASCFKVRVLNQRLLIPLSHMVNFSVACFSKHSDVQVFCSLLLRRCAGTEAADEAVCPVAGAAVSKSGHGREVAVLVP
jgi:hypothetical protein